MSGAAIVAAWRTVSTPGRLLRAMAAIVALAALATVASLWAASGIRDAAQTIGRDAEPSVALALHMAAILGDLDAAAAVDALTDGGATIGTSRQFHDGMADLAGDLVEAARNITYGEAEAAPLRELQRMLALYQEAIVEARYIGAGSPAVTSLRVQWASRLNRDFVLPQADALATANADELERHYAAYRAHSGLAGGLAVAAFALLTATLVGTQAWLARRTRRLLNPLLAAASLLTLASLIWFALAVLGEREDLRAAKFDAYDSLHVLFEAKAAVNTIRADMSLWLLDPAARPAAQARMDAAAHALIGTDLAVPEQTRPLFAALQHALALEQDGDVAGALAAAPHPGGLLGTELDNVTYGVPERDAATQSVARLAEAEGIVRTVQTQEQQRQGRSLAVSHWLDDRPGGGAAAFAAVQAALDRTLKVNQDEFDRHVASALGNVALIPFVAGGAMALTALLAVAGLWLRLREYR
jgi:hypothetical protein